MLDRHSLLSLGQYRNSEQPVLSLYLNIDRQSTETQHLIQLKNMVTALEGQRDQYSTEQWQHVQVELNRLREWVRDSYAGGGTSVAVFACADDLWQSYSIPYELQCRLLLGDRPRLRPLYRLLQRFEHYLALLTDARDTRICLVTPEGTREVVQLEGATPGRHDQGGWAQARIQRHQDRMVEAHLERAANHAFRLFQDEAYDGIVLMGTEERTAPLAERLHPYLKEHVLARLPLGMDANLHEIGTETLKIGRAHRRARHEGFLHEWEETLKAGRQSVAGLPDTLRAAQQGQLMTLLIKEDLSAEGGKCVRCAALTAETEGRCNYCGGMIRYLEDVTEALTETALGQGAELVFLTVDSGARRLRRYGGVGAILRYALA